MKRITWILSLLFAGNAFSQAPTVDFKYGVMLSNLSSVQHGSTMILSPVNVPVAVENTTTVDWLQLMPSFTWQTKKGDFGQLSLPLWQLQRQKTVRVSTNFGDTTGYDRTMNVGVQYTYSIRFLKQKQSKWLPMLGFGVMPYFQRAHFEPTVDTQFAISNTKAGLQGKLQPHVMWTPTSHFFVDMGLSLSIFDVNASSYIDGLPTVPLQGGYTINWDMLSGSNGLQVGVGLKI